MLAFVLSLYLPSCIVRNHPEYGYLGALGGKGRETHPNGYSLAWNNEKSFTDGTQLAGRVASVIGAYKTAGIFAKSDNVASNNSVLKNASNNDLNKAVDSNATKAAINANNNATLLEKLRIKNPVTP